MDSLNARLAVLSQDGKQFVAARAVATLQEAFENWTSVAPSLAEQAELLAREGGEKLDHATLLAPLPRSWQWLDGSAFKSHGDLMDKVLGNAPLRSDRPLMYQGVSDTFYAPTEDVPFPSEDLGIDFEGEFGVIVDEVAMGTTASDAMRHIRLIVQMNDWSLRTLAGPEMKTGFGWVQAKPPSSMAPFAAMLDVRSWRTSTTHVDLSKQVYRPNRSSYPAPITALTRWRRMHRARGRSRPRGTLRFPMLLSRHLHPAAHDSLRLNMRLDQVSPSNLQTLS